MAVSAVPVTLVAFGSLFGMGSLGRSLHLLKLPGPVWPSWSSWFPERCGEAWNYLLKNQQMEKSRKNKKTKQKGKRTTRVWLQCQGPVPQIQGRSQLASPRYFGTSLSEAGVRLSRGAGSNEMCLSALQTRCHDLVHGTRRTPCPWASRKCLDLGSKLVFCIEKSFLLSSSSKFTLRADCERACAVWCHGCKRCTTHCSGQCGLWKPRFLLLNLKGNCGARPFDFWLRIITANNHHSWENVEMWSFVRKRVETGKATFLFSFLVMRALLHVAGYLFRSQWEGPLPDPRGQEAIKGDNSFPSSEKDMVMLVIARGFCPPEIPSCICAVSNRVILNSDPESERRKHASPGALHFPPNPARLCGDPP